MGELSETAMSEREAKLFDLAWELVAAITGGGPLPHSTPKQRADEARPILLGLLEARNTRTPAPVTPGDGEGRAASNCQFYPACYVCGDCDFEGWKVGRCGLPKVAHPSPARMEDMGDGDWVDIGPPSPALDAGVREDVARIVRLYSLHKAPDGWRLFRDGQRIEGPWPFADTPLAEVALSEAIADAILSRLQASPLDRGSVDKSLTTQGVDGIIGQEKT